MTHQTYNRLRFVIDIELKGADTSNLHKVQHSLYVLIISVRLLIKLLLRIIDISIPGPLKKDVFRSLC